MLRITALMDDLAGDREGILSEHGLSYYIEYGGSRLLLDCGNTGAFLQNAQLLGIDLTDLDMVVLSHGHYDHAGGYTALAEAGLAPGELWTGPEFFRKKYSMTPQGPMDRSAGFGPELLEKHGIRHRVVKDCRQILPGLWLLGGFPRENDFETIPQHFLRQGDPDPEPDPFDDEIAIACRLEDGLAVLAGCSHPGIGNMVGHICGCLGMPVRAVFGGTHLMDAQPRRIQRTLEQLEQQVRLLGFGHCTGQAALEAIRESRRFQSCRLRSGDTLELPAPRAENRSDT